MLPVLLALISSVTAEWNWTLPGQPSPDSIPTYASDNCIVTNSRIAAPFNASTVEGTWHLYQHQPDLVEGLITAGCHCTKSVLSPPTSPNDILEISNICNYFTNNGPIVPVHGQITAIAQNFTDIGAWIFTLNGQEERYQILDVTEDNQWMLATVCGNGFGLITLRSYCVYYFGRSKPLGKPMEADVLSRFIRVAQDNGLYRPENMRLDYEGSETC